MDNLDAWAEAEHAEWVQQQMSEECEEKVKKAKKQGAVEELKKVIKVINENDNNCEFTYKPIIKILEKRLKELGVKQNE